MAPPTRPERYKEKLSNKFHPMDAGQRMVSYAPFGAKLKNLFNKSTT